MKKKTAAFALGALATGACGYAALRMALNAIIAPEKPKYMPDGKGFMGRIQESFAEHRDIMNSSSARLHARNPEKVYITNKEGLRLCGHWIEAEAPKRTVVMMHGFRSGWDKDFAVAVDFFVGCGCNLLIIEQRARGESEGKYITYGIRERFDCIEWLVYADSRCGGKLPLYADGISMGAGTVMLASELDMPKNVAGILADCGFTSPAEIISYVMKQSYGLPEKPIVPILSALCKKVAGFGFYDRSTEDALKNNKRPLLLIHGEDDFFVPCEMSVRNYNATAGPKELVIVPGAGHGLSYIVDREACESAILRFFDSCEQNWTAD